MPIPSSISDLSPTAASNSPLGSEPPTEGDNHLRALGAIIRQVYDANVDDGGSDLIGFIQAGTGAVARTAQDKMREVVSVLDFGADSTGVADSTTEIAAAVATGLHVSLSDGTFKLTDMITVSTKGQVIQGAGKYKTIITIDSASFNMSADGVFKFLNSAPVEPGPVLRDLTILFDQPDSAVRANYHQYPPALHAVSQPRFVIDNCRILQAWDGIDMTGNSGGAAILGLDLFSYNVGIDIDGALDSVRIDRLHWYNFLSTANQATVFYDSNNIGVKSARCDDFHMHDSLFIGGQACNFYASGSGETFGCITNCDFDTNRGILMSAGYLSGAALFFSIGSDGKKAIAMTGGFLRLSSLKVTAAAALTNPLIELNMSSSSSGLLQISTIFADVAGDTKVIYAGNSSSGKAELHVGSGKITRRPNTAESNPTIHGASGSRVVINGPLSMSDKGTGAGDWLQLDADDNHYIADVMALGWGMTIPSAVGNTYIRDVAGGLNDIAQGNIIGAKKTRYFTGSLSAGSATVAHGVSSAQQRVIGCDAYFKNGGGAAQPLTMTIDGTNINLTGGSGTAAYRAVLSYIDTQQGW